MNKTKIEWCDMTWNPVTGCLHGCPYCYARNEARRFAGHDTAPMGVVKAIIDGNHTIYEISSKLQRTTKDGKIVVAAFPLGFEPVLHRYRLEEPQLVKKPQNIFVCSMADLFGKWVPDEWIKTVFEACQKAPQHRYLFLTKNPGRYIDLNKKKILPNNCNYWFGSTTTTEESTYWYSENHNYFISIEPIECEFSNLVLEANRIIGAPLYPKWVIIGAETGNRKGKIIPKREWIENIVRECRLHGIPVFMKDSLKEIWIKPLIREYPWETQKKQGVDHD
jgi:protein gp37